MGESTESTTRSTPRWVSDYTETLVAFLHDDFPWLAPALAAGSIVFLLYLLTHPYPAYGSGLFLLMAEEISRNGYRLPTRIPYYGEGGIPFAYPPFVFYAVAFLRDLVAVDPIALTRYVPGILTVAYLVPAYLLGRALLDSRRQAGFAALLIALSPNILQWQIAAGGIVRATAYLFMVSGLVTGLHLFRTGERRWLLPSILLFSLTALSHPKYVVFFVLSYLLFWLAYDPTTRGLTNGALVAAGGFVLTAPWWAQVAETHGFEIFLRASGTHRGVARIWTSLDMFVRRHLYGPHILRPMVAWNVLPVLAGVYLVAKRRLFLPLWGLSTVLVTGESRFVFLVGAFMTAAFVFDGIVPVTRSIDKPRRGRIAAVGVIVVITVYGLALTGAFAAGYINTYAYLNSLPQFIDDDDTEAMEWVEGETPPDAQFVVLGDAAEWFPYFTHRTILVSPWGAEWNGDDTFRRHDDTMRTLAACDTETCVTETLREGDFRPDYVYVPKGEYSIRGWLTEREPQLERSMTASDRYRVVYENDGAIVYRVTEWSDRDSASRFSVRSGVRQVRSPRPIDTPPRRSRGIASPPRR